MNHLALLISSYLALSGRLEWPSNVNQTEWERYKLEFGKSYENGKDEALRRTIYADNKKRIDHFQQQSQSFSLKLNHLADWTGLEKSKLNGFKLPEELEYPVNSPEAEKFLQDILADNSTEVPDELDWRKVPGRVSNVKDQGMCGSCWAFASTGALEGQEGPRSKLAINGKDLIELSEQNLVDCVKADNGCDGGIMSDAFEYIKSNGGIDDEASYPYEAVSGKCRFKKNKIAFSDKGFAVLPTGDEEKLKQVVAKFGPVAVAIDANSVFFQLYNGGIYDNPTCSEDQLDHAVLIVGYGTDPKGGDYWLVKNSWNITWGDEGYIKMSRNKKNQCGIATLATIPIY